MMRLTMRNIIECAIFAIILIFSLAMPDTDVIYVSLFMVWTGSVFYCLRDIHKRAMLFAFLITFFIFLLGRDFVKQFLSYELEPIERKAEVHVWISFLISLLSLVFSFNFFTERVKREDKKPKNLSIKSKIYKQAVRQNSLMFFYISYVFAIISKIAVIIYVYNSSFTQYYVGYSDYLKRNTLLYIISKIEIMMPISWAIYLGTFPKKRDIRLPLALYFIYLLLSLGTGQRSTSMLGLIFLLVYYLFRDRDEEVWISKKLMIAGLISLPFLALFISFYEMYRKGASLESISLIDGGLKFLYDQGVTSTIVKKAYIYKGFIPDQIYSLEFMHSGILARLFNIPVYHGNNVDHALYGGSFAHSLSYITMRNSYLAGMGTGSSYIAELYQDFSYPGIVLGNILYAYIIYKISDLDKNKYISNGYKLFIIPFILWAPRGSLTNFISQSLTPSTIAVFLVIFTFSYAMSYRDINPRSR